MNTYLQNNRHSATQQATFLSWPVHSNEELNTNPCDSRLRGYYYSSHAGDPCSEKHIGQNRWHTLPTSSMSGSAPALRRTARHSVEPYSTHLWIGRRHIKPCRRSVLLIDKVEKIGRWELFMIIRALSLESRHRYVADARWAAQAGKYAKGGGGRLPGGNTAWGRAKHIIRWSHVL